MSHHMHISHSLLIVSLSCALSGCLDAADTADGDAPDIAVTQQAIFHNEVRLRKIQSVNLWEGGDEIYLNASQSSGGGINVIRPSGDPDYFRFDSAPFTRTMDLHVGTIVSGSLLIVNMWEQEPFDHHEIGTVDFGLTNAGAPKTYDTPSGHFHPKDGSLFVAHFINGASYLAWFQVGP